MPVVRACLDERAFGPRGQEVVSLIERMSRIDWFSAAGKPQGRAEAEQAVGEFTRRLGVERYSFRWITKDQLFPFLDGMSLAASPLWRKLEEIPQKIRDQVDCAGRGAWLAAVTEHVPEWVFHSSYDGAFREFVECGETVVTIAVGAVMYTCGLACAWETIGDLEGWNANPYRPLLDVFAQGHWPLGLFDDQFYLI